MNEIAESGVSQKGAWFGVSRGETEFIFDHIPKTGGSALRTVFEQIFGIEEVSPAVTGRSERWAEHRYARYKMITGHFHSPLPMRAVANSRARITMLRDPIDRAVSEYFYYRNDVERAEWNKLAVFAKDHDLYGYISLLEAQRDAAISNYYSQRFASQISRQSISRMQTLELAKEALARYDFVGIQEHFVDSVDLFCCRFGLPPVPDVPRVNVTSSRKRLNDLDGRTRKKLIDMNQLDVELYEYALQEFQAQKRQIFHRFAGKGVLKASLGDIDTWIKTREEALGKPEAFGNRSVEICGAGVVGRMSGTAAVRPGEETIIWLLIEAHTDVPNLTVGIEISDELGEIVFGTNTYLLDRCRSIERGQRYKVTFSFPANMKHGRYEVGASLHTGATHVECCFHWCDEVTSFSVADELATGFVGYCRLVPEVDWSPLPSES